MSQQKPAAWATIKNGIPETWMWNPEFVEKNKDAEVVLYSAPVEREQEPVAVVEITYGREPECYVTGNIDDFPEGVFKLYAAPVQHAEQEPVAWMDEYNNCKCPDNESRCFSDKVFRMMQKYSSSVSQEPIAWQSVNVPWNMTTHRIDHELWRPLYAAPVRTKDLTDDEIERALDAANVTELPDGYKNVDIEIARAVIAADREKNRG